MRTENLVSVWVKHPADQNGCEWALATGYCVAPNKVLTCRHVLKSGWSEIEIKGLYANQNATPAKIVWPPVNPGDGYVDADHLDAILLNWDFPKEIRFVKPGFLLAVRERPVDWFFNWFPHSIVNNQGAPNGPPSYYGLQGTLNPPPKADRVMPLDCQTKGLPTSIWKGASGSPVFERDGLEIIGILKSMDLGPAVTESGQTAYPIERLIAVPMWKIVESPGFMEECGFRSASGFREVNEKWLRSAPERLHSILNRVVDLGVIQALKADLGLPKRCELMAVCETIARDPKLVNTLVALRKAHNQLDQDSVDCLMRAELLLLPMGFSSAQREEFWTKYEQEKMVLVTSAAVSRAGAQLRIAARDGRPAGFPGGIDGNEDRGHWLGEGGLVLGTLPSNMSSKAVALMIVLKIARSLLGPKLIAVSEEDYEQILNGKASQQTIARAMERFEDTATAIQKVVETKSSWIGTPYCMIEPEHRSVPRHIICEAIEPIRRLIPELIFLEVLDPKTAPSLLKEELPQLMVLETQARRAP